MYKPRPEYDTPEYKAWRYAVFARDKWTCQITGKKGCELEAHHILPWAKYPHLRYATSNGITLEKNFHRQVVTGREEEYVEQFKKIVEMKRLQRNAERIARGKKGTKKKLTNYRLRNPRARF